MIPPAKQISLLTAFGAAVSFATAFNAASPRRGTPPFSPRVPSSAAATAIHDYLDQIGANDVQQPPTRAAFYPPSSSNPPPAAASMGAQVADALTITDPCAFDAASSDIKSAIAERGSISSSEIASVLSRTNAVVSIIRRHFPGAIGSSQVIPRVRSVLESFGCDATNTLLTQSVCPDEINHEPGDITDLFIRKYGGKVFHLGGLAGVPFTGRTGFGAFSAHVPDGGHAFVLHAPHVGMSDDLELGKYSRQGQAGEAGAACGAAVGAMCRCRAGLPLPDLGGSSDDYQMNYLVHEIGRCMDILNAAPDENSRQAELARQSHRIGKTMLDEIVSTDFGCDSSLLFVLSGIQINMPFDFEDYFQPLSFEVRKKDGSVTDLLEWTFGGASTDPFPPTSSPI